MENPGIVWSALDNDDVVRHTDKMEGLAKSPSTGNFFADYHSKCTLLGVMPHPQVLKQSKACCSDTEVIKQVDEDKKKSAPPKKDEKKIASLNPGSSPQSIHVHGWILDVGTLTALQYTMPAYKSLTTLKLWNASLSTNALRVLSLALPKSSITVLYVDFCITTAVDLVLPVSLNESDAKEASNTAEDSASCSPQNFSLAEIVQPNLAVLSLRGNRINDEQLSDICSKLALSKTIQYLNLDFNEIASEGCGNLCQLLRKNRSISILSLSHNQIDDDGFCKLIEPLSQFPLRDDEIKLKKQFEPIVMVGKKPCCAGNKVLTRMNLSHNQILNHMPNLNDDIQNVTIVV